MQIANGYHNPKLRFSPLRAPSKRSSFPLELEFNLFSMALALMFNTEYRFARYLYSLAFINLENFTLYENLKLALDNKYILVDIAFVRFPLKNFARLNFDVKCFKRLLGFKRN